MPIFTALPSGVLALTLALAPAPAAPLLDSATQNISIEMPAPGETIRQSIATRNIAPTALEVGLSIVALDGDAVTGSHPLRVSILDADGTVLIADATRAGSAVSLGAVASRATRSVTVQASLPAEAGNEYQGVDAIATIRFGAIGVDMPTPPSTTSLSETGLMPAGIIAAGAALIFGGFFLRALRRRRAVAA